MYSKRPFTLYSGKDNSIYNNERVRANLERNISTFIMKTITLMKDTKVDLRK